MGRPSVSGWILGFFLSSLLPSCTYETGYAELIEHDERQVDSPRFYFMYPNTDTLSLRDMTLAVRYTDTYGKDRLNLRFECLSPSNRLFSDTVSLVLFDEGTKKFGDRKTISQYDLERTLLEKAVFAEHGVYRITFLPLGTIGGVNALGLTIKTSK